MLRFYQNILKPTHNGKIQSNAELKILVDALISLDVRIVYQSKMTIVNSLLVNLANFDTVSCLAHIGIVNRYPNDLYVLGQTGLSKQCRHRSDAE